MNTSTVNCPHCQKPNYTTATKCWKCETPLDVQRLLQEQISRQYRCSRCHSDDTSSYEMIYQSGTNTGRFSSVSYNYNVGLISTGGKSKSQSLLAQQVTPPKMPSSTGCGKFVLVFLLLMIAATIFLTFTISGFVLGGKAFGDFNGTVIVGGIAAILGGSLAFVFLKYFSNQLDKQNNPKEQKANWQKEYAKWQNSWLCLKCGNRWFLNQ